MANFLLYLALHLYLIGRLFVLGLVDLSLAAQHCHSLTDPVVLAVRLAGVVGINILLGLSKSVRSRAHCNAVLFSSFLSVGRGDILFAS